MAGDSIEEKIDGVLDQPGITLIVANPEEYLEDNRRLMKLLTDRGLPGIYVTVNKPYDAITEFLEEDGVDTSEIFFIDAVSEGAGGSDEGLDNVMFIESPKHLTDISIVLSQANEEFGERERFLFFDSLSMLTIYNNVETVSKFAHYLTGKIRSWNAVGVIISVREDMDDQLLSRLQQFCDRTIEL